MDNTAGNIETKPPDILAFQRYYSLELCSVLNLLLYILPQTFQSVDHMYTS